MTTPQALHHSLLRPCILHILRAAGYHSTRPSVLDTLTDLAARYIHLLAQSAVGHANHNESMEISIQDVRMAMQDCGALSPEKPLEDQEYDGEEDTRGVEEFLAWITGPANKEIRRIALEGTAGSHEDYLAVLKKKHSTTDEDSRYTGTVLGRPAELRSIKVEGGEVENIKDWEKKLRTASKVTSLVSSRRPSSALSSLGDVEEMEF